MLKGLYRLSGLLPIKPYESTKCSVYHHAWGGVQKDQPENISARFAPIQLQHITSINHGCYKRSGNSTSLIKQAEANA